MKLLGILTAGLRPDSRVAIEQSGEDYSIDTLMMAALTDATRAIVHGLFSKKGAKMPPQLVDALRKKKKQSEIRIFSSPEEFRKRRAEIMKKRKDNG